MRSLSIGVLSLLFCSYCMMLNAAHISGGWIEYEQLDTSSYFVKHTMVFGDLSGSPPSYSILYVEDIGTGGIDSFLLMMEFSGIIEQRTFSGCLGIDNLPGKVATYANIINLIPNNDGYYLYVKHEFRDANLQNLVNPSNQGQSLVCTIPGFSSIGINSSPKFDSIFRTFVCKDLPFTIDLSLEDPDGDSLSYRLEDATKLLGGSPPFQYCTYASGYSGQVPLGTIAGTNLNPVTGVLSGTLSEWGTWLIKLVIDEFRNGQLIASYDREMIMNAIVGCYAVPVAVIGDGQQGDTIAVCDGYTYQFENSSLVANNYYWDFDYPNGIDTSTATNPTYTYPDTGTYTVMLVAKGDSCIDTAFTKLMVYPFTIADFSVSTPSCINGSIQFTDQSTSTHDPVVDHYWEFGDGTTSVLQSPQHTYVSPPPIPEPWYFSVQLEIQTYHGCIAQVTKQIPIDTVPEAQLPSYQPICLGDTIYPNYVSTASGFQWQPATGVVCDTCLSPGFYASSVTTYTLTLTNGACFTDKALSVITVNPPQPQINMGTQSLCLGNAIPLSSSISASSYLWSTGETTKDIQVAQSGLYGLTVTGINGCIGTDTIELNLAPLPNPSIVAINGVFGCPGELLPLTLNQTYAQHQWSGGLMGDTVIAYGGNTVSVDVTDSNGCGASDTIELFEHPIDTLEIQQNTTVTGCQVDTITLYAGTGYAAYNWSTGATTDSIELAQSGTYWVEVTDGNGCTQQDTVSVTFTPTVSIQNGDTVHACNGEMVQLSAQYNTAEIMWSTGDTTASISVSQGGIYIATVGEAGCFFSDTVEVLIHQSPNPAIVVLGMDTICQGDTTGLLATTPQSGLHTYSWNTGSQDSIIQVTSTNVYEVTVTNQFGCSGSDIQHIWVSPEPQVQVSAGQSQICLGDSVTISANWSNGLLEWMPASLGVPNNQSTFMDMPGSSTTYYGQVTTVYGCIAIDSTTVQVNPTPSISILPQDTSICAGAAVSYTVTGVGTNTIQWTPAANLSNPSIYNPISSPQTSITYTVEVIDSNGCVALDTAHILVDSIPEIVGNIQTSQSQSYSNGKVLLIEYNPLDSMVTAIDSTWTDGQGNFAFFTSQPQVYIKATPDSSTYPNELPSYYQSALVWDSADVISIQPCDSIFLSFSTIGGTNPGGPGFIAGNVFQGAGKMMDRSDPIEGLILILLDGAGNPVDVTITDQEGYYRFGNLAVGQYSIWGDEPFMKNTAAPEVELTASANQIDSLWLKYYDRQLFLDPTAIPHSAVPEMVSVYPNPATTYLYLKAEAALMHDVEISIVNAIGNRVVYKSFTQGLPPLDIRDLPAGMYFLELLHNGERQVLPVSIIR